MFRFQKFDVWHKAVDFADNVYEATLVFPADERFGLMSQMRRAAVSISSNIAEGSSRTTDKEFARFLEIAYGSLMEVVSQSVIAHRQKFLPGDSCDTLTARAEELAKMLSSLRKRLTS